MMTGIKLSVVVVLLSACTSLPTNPSGKPAWIENPGDGAIGYSAGHVLGRYFQEDIAIARARDNLARKQQNQAQTTISSTTDSTRSSVVRQTVKAKIRAVWQNQSSGELWVWVYPTGSGG